MTAGQPASEQARRAVRAGLMITSTSSISSVRAPLTAASNISRSAGDGVWWTTISLGMLAELSVRAGSLNHGADVTVLICE